MKYWLTIIPVLFMLAQSHAQDFENGVDSMVSVSKDSSNHKKLKDSTVLTIITDKAGLVQGKIDSINQHLNGLRQHPYALVDSVKSKVTSPVNNIRGLRSEINDSINTSFSGFEEKIHANRISNTVDSLNNRALPQSKYLHKADSIKSLNPLANVQEKIDAQQSRVKKKTDVPVKVINEKLNILSKESGGKGNLPQNVSAPDGDLPLQSFGMPETDLPGGQINTNVNVPSTDISSLQMPESPLKQDLGKELALPEINSPEINSLDKISEKTGDLSVASERISGYSKDVSDIKQGNTGAVVSLENRVISAVPVQEELTALQQREQLIKEHQDKISAIKNSGDYKKQTLERAKKIVVQHLVLHEAQLQGSIGKVSAYQNKMGTILSKKNDLPKRRDPLRKLKTFEKFVPGITFQINKPDAWLVDINPSLRYRLTSYWSVGSGWNERVLFGRHSQEFDDARIYGIRSFTEVIVFKGFAARLEIENMNVFVTPSRVVQDVGYRDWIWRYMAGIKKEFSFLPKVTGNVQFMYNVYAVQKHYPYSTRFNVRFGFERLLKAKKRTKTR